jgi:large subunit ribosomal protein L24
MQKKYHVKKGDKVKVNSGEWKNREATVTALLTKKDRVVLEISGLTQEERDEKLGKRVKKTQDAPKGVLVERSVSVHVSNVNKVAEDKKEQG